MGLRAAVRFLVGAAGSEVMRSAVSFPASPVWVCSRLKVSHYLSVQGDFSTHCIMLFFFALVEDSLSSSFLEFISIVTSTKEVMFSSPFVCLLVSRIMQ